MSSSLDTGAIVAGRYRIEQVIGSGAVGTVYAARDETGGVDVALKILRAMDTNAQVRFVREGQAVAQIRSEHIARVLDCGRAEGDLLYIALERLSGKDLEQI